MPLPRRRRGACSPIAQRMASTTFDLPQPLGPTIAVMPGWNAKLVLSTKLLKPLIWSDLIRTRDPPRSLPARAARPPRVGGDVVSGAEAGGAQVVTPDGPSSQPRTQGPASPRAGGSARAHAPAAATGSSAPA